MLLSPRGIARKSDVRANTDCQVTIVMVSAVFEDIDYQVLYLLNTLQTRRKSFMYRDPALSNGFSVLSTSFQILLSLNDQCFISPLTLLGNLAIASVAFRAMEINSRPAWMPREIARCSS